MPPLAERWVYRELLARQPGYRRRLDLRGPTWEALIDLFIFVDAAAACAALDDPGRRRFVAERPAYRDTTLALLADAGNKNQGRPAILLRLPEDATSPPEGEWLRERLVPNG